MNRKSHWDTVYLTKQPEEVGWTQKIPTPSLKMIRGLDLPKSTSIIDVGGGDSHLIEFLLKDGFTDLTVLDISKAGVERAKIKLGSNADKIHWIVSDILDFRPTRTYHLWHDRAAFHFLTEKDQIDTYKNLTSKSVSGFMTIGTFSVNGPNKCSGLEIRQYDEALLNKEFCNDFKLIESFTENHITPSGNSQNFVFATFERKNN